jgi:hypothetical protein
MSLNLDIFQIIKNISIEIIDKKSKDYNNFWQLSLGTGLGGLYLGLPLSNSYHRHEL